MHETGPAGAHGPEDAATDKARHREVARAARQALDPEARAAAAEAIARRAMGLPEVARARSVLAYSALPEEADPGPIVRALRERGARIALPRVCGARTLALHWTTDSSELISGPFGIAEPDGTCETASPDDLDLVLVPGVAFDAACGRLGFGGGYYDDLLASLPHGTATVGIAYDEQMCDKVPSQDHDVTLDAVVTPSGVHRSGGRRSDR